MGRSFFISLLFLAALNLEASTELKDALEKKAGGSTDMPISKEHQMQAFKAESFEGQVPEHKFSLGESLSDYYSDGPLVLTFYRGHWCPYCLLELKEYQKHYDKFKQLGAKVVAVAPDLPGQIKKTKDKYNLSYTLISDEDHALAKKLGLAFELDSETLNKYKSYGIDLAGSQGNKGDTLPMPGTYVIDSTGQVVYAFVDPNYKKRAEPLDVLKAVEEIQASQD